MGNQEAVYFRTRRGKIIQWSEESKQMQTETVGVIAERVGGYKSGMEKSDCMMHEVCGERMMHRVE